MPEIKIGAAELPAKDVAYIRALVRLFSFGQNVQWQFVEQAPYDVLVVDGEVTPEHVALISGKSCLLLRVRRERRSALSRIGSNDSIDYPIRALQLKAWLRANQAALLSSPATKGYRLRRWPSTALLQGDALKIHMATLLSKSTLTPRSLAALVGQPEADCVQFIGQLKEAGVLRDAKAGVREIVKTSPLPDAAPVQRSLLGSIRRRLKEIWA